ncbi:glycoside hydrolase family 2 TIM barrel-domain containing protein [Amycolatopsis sp. NPDC023774]|uniref:glycoside hydrolase family 2 TIM barrel-domain containing protein n=1 Tax=Amycolatopsis sp. NPDC023774 TaxID=3155015 RepID=UPI003409549C
MPSATVDFLDARTGRVTDTVTRTLGLREPAVDPDEEFFLNGTHVALHGINAHQDRLDEGWAVADRQRDRDFDLMDEMGVTDAADVGAHPPERPPPVQRVLGHRQRAGQERRRHRRTASCRPSPTR